MNDRSLSSIFGRGTPENPYPSGGRWSDLFGIEFELEQPRSGLSEEASRWWVAHNDGSLVEGIEYVLGRPVGMTDLVAAVDSYYNSNIQASGGARTSTHVHINGGDLTVDQLRSMVAIVYTIEDDLYRFVDEERKWAGYSCGLAEMDPRRLRAIMSEDDPFRLSQQINNQRGGERYYGFNVASLARHGSVEFRYFPGMPDRAALESYLDLAEGIKKAAQTNPIEALIGTVDSEARLNTFLSVLLPGNIRDGLLSMGTPRSRWEAFNRIAMLAQPDGTINRQDQLVKVVPQLVHALVKAKRLSPIGGQYLKTIGDKLGVMTIRDFTFHLDHARTLKGDPEKKVPKKRPTRPMPVDLDVWRGGEDYPDNPFTPPHGNEASPANYIQHEVARLQERARLQAAGRPSPGAPVGLRNPFRVNPNIGRAGSQTWVTYPDPLRDGSGGFNSVSSTNQEGNR